MHTTNKVCDIRVVFFFALLSSFVILLQIENWNYQLKNWSSSWLQGIRVVKLVGHIKMDNELLDEQMSD
jgi:hypothetical protein